MRTIYEYTIEELTTILLERIGEDWQSLNNVSIEIHEESIGDLVTLDSKKVIRLVIR